MNWTDALGSTLIHFLWQGAVISIVLAVALAMLRNAGPRARYAAGCTALLLMLCTATATFVYLRFAQHFADPLEVQSAKTSEYIASIHRTHPDAVFSQRSAGTTYLLFFVWAWFGGVFALSIRSLGGWAVATRLSRLKTWPAEPIWEARFAELARRLSVTKPVRLLMSAAAEVPAVVGWFRPVVLMPAAIFSGLTVEQVEALLAHELAHVRRHDYIVNLMQTAAETLLFYHPAVWWISRTVRIERENCCDDLAVAVTGDTAEYVRALTELELRRGTVPGIAVAANGGALLARAERLLRLTKRKPAPSGMLAILGIAAVCLAVAGIAASTSAQSRSTSAERNAATSNTAAPQDVIENPEKRTPLLAETGRAVPVVSPAQDLLSGAQQTNNSGAPLWLDGIEAQGFRNLTVDQLIALKIHGVNADYIRQIRDAGFDPNADKLIELKIHRVDASYIQQIRATGLQMTLDRLVEFRIHGITPDFMAEMNRAGFQNLTAEKLIELKIHGISSDWVQGIRTLGYSDISADRAIELRIHGITPEYIRKAKDRFKDLTLDQVVQLKQFDILRLR